MSQSATYSYPRPVGVTILVVLLWIQAVLGIFGGLFLIFEHNDASLITHLDRSSDTLMVYGIAALIVGLITALVAWALGNASNFARWLVAIVTILHLAGGIYSFFALDGVTRGSAIVEVIVSIVVLYILFGEKGSEEFFTG